MTDENKMPRIVFILFVVDFVLCASYVINYLIGEPFFKLTHLLDLGNEMNLPTWYSSTKLFFISVLLGIFALRNIDRSIKTSWVLLSFAALFLAFSIDEVALIHEWLGIKLDNFILPSGKRKDTFFTETGIWMFALGVPVFLFCLLLLFYGHQYFKKPRRAPWKFMLGLCVFFGGAIGVETLSNVTRKNKFAFVMENFFEEGLEMVGATIILWAILDMLLAHGFSWHLDPVDQRSSQ